MKFLNIFSFGAVLVSSLTAVTALPIDPASIVARDLYGSDALFARGDLEAREPWGWLAKLAAKAAPHVIPWFLNKIKRDDDDDLLDAILSRAPQDDDDLADILSQLSRRGSYDLEAREPWGWLTKFIRKAIPIAKKIIPIAQKILGRDLDDVNAILSRVPQDDDELADILSQLSRRDYHDLVAREPWGWLTKFIRKAIPIAKKIIPIAQKILGRDDLEAILARSPDAGDALADAILSELSKRDVSDIEAREPWLSFLASALPIAMPWIKKGVSYLAKKIRKRDFDDDLMALISRDFSDDAVADFVSNVLTRRDIWDDILDTREIDFDL
jgi:hypothetical protein